ncbi:uncharacterized protein G6M90_00g065080 [Metarhizium brunneum]|uniref:Uncharacterized protein n=1 Tax=Metarhizium brunneum TaxID=500148 RepID=A0A7D5UYA8_9HYPO|nr:hypothetical protein G6M90_00g065080 [Metarhizium brunneum]
MSFRCHIQELKDENDLIKIDEEVDLDLELAVIVLKSPVGAVIYKSDPMVPVTAWAVMQAAEVLSLRQAAALPIRMAWNLFRSHDLWFILRVDEPKLHTLNTDMRTLSKKVGHTVFTSELGFCIPLSVFCQRRC